MRELLLHPMRALPALDSGLQQTLRRVARNATWLFSGQTLSRLIGFALGTVLARTLGAGDFGRYTVVMTAVMYFAFMADAGLGRFLIRDAARQPGHAADLLAQVGGLRLALAALVYLLLLAAAVLTGASAGQVGWVAIAGLTLFSGALSGALSSLFNAREEMHISAVFGVLSTALTALFVVAALVAGLGLTGIFSAVVLANLPPLLYLAWQWRRRNGSLRLAADLPYWWATLRQAFPYALLGVIGLIYFRIDSLLLTWLKGPEANGVYSAAYRLLDAITDIPGVLVAAIFPTMARLHVESKARVRKTYLTAMAALALLGVPVLIGLLILARPIILLLYGEEFVRSVAVLRLLSLAVFLIFIDTANTMVLYATENLRPVVLLSLVTMSANIALCLLLIPAHAEQGAAMATVLSSAFSIAIFTPVVLRSLRS